MPKHATRSVLSVLLLALAAGCHAAPAEPVPAAQRTAAPSGSAGDAAFAALVQEILRDTFRRGPTNATYLGIHDHDDQLEDFSPRRSPRRSRTRAPSRRGWMPSGRPRSRRTRGWTASSCARSWTHACSSWT